MKYRPLARERDVQLTMAHDDWEVSSVTGCGAIVDVVVEQSEDATQMLRLRLHRKPGKVVHFW
jgi:hypothetical protein